MPSFANTTIRYWMPHDQKCRYISFATYRKALEMQKWYSEIAGFKAEIVV